MPALSVVLILSAASVIEEIFFRGFLLSYAVGYGRKTGIFISALFFSGYHLTNAFAGGDVLFVVFQAIFAFISGLCFAQITLRYNSLLPGTVLHALINITGSSNTTQSDSYWVGFCMCLMCYLVVIVLHEKTQKTAIFKQTV